jgi:small subunit ribosomal protein S17
MPIRDIGIDVRAPPREPAANDNLNPFNGSLSIRGSIIVATVVSTKMQSTCIVEKEHMREVPKYERLEKRTRRYAAHVPGNIDVKVGDEVVIAECRPLTKTVHFVVVENRGNPTLRRAEAKGAA